MTVDRIEVLTVTLTLYYLLFDTPATAGSVHVRN